MRAWAKIPDEDIGKLFPLLADVPQQVDDGDVDPEQAARSIMGSVHARPMSDWFDK